jgi:hypothetical protein
MKYKLQLQSLSKISDDQLLSRLSELVQQSRHVEAELVAHIGEVEARRLYAREAAPSMFVYCRNALGLSEHEAYLRIGVARAIRKHPILLEMLADGRLFLSGIARLAPILTEANRERVLARAAGMSKREIEELLVELAPKKDVPATMRKLPERREQTKPNPSHQLVPERVENAEQPNTNPSTPAPTKPPAMTPLAPAKYKIQFTASAGLRDKLERLRALMRSSVPDGDLAAIIEEAVTEKLERLESKRFAKTKAPRKSLKDTDTSATSRHIPAAVKRAVYERDKGQCTYVGKNGRRCTERDRLEFHHRNPYGRGGRHSVGNIQLTCRTHNSYFAERDYGNEVMARYRRSSSRISEPAPTYAVGDRAAIWRRAHPPG